LQVQKKEIAMKRFTILSAIAMSVALFVGLVIAEDPRDLVQKGRDYALYDLSALPSGLRSNEQVYFVDSTHTNASDVLDRRHGESWIYPFATIDYALDQMVAGGGAILVAPGHAESVVSAADWAMDIAGVSIHGKGSRDNGPVITMSTVAAASVQITADDCLIEGLTFVCNIDSMTHGIDVNAADDLIIRDCVFKEGGSDGDVNGLTWITADGADADADRMLIDNCQFLCYDATNWTSAIELAQDFTGVTIRNSYIFGDFVDAGIEIPAGGNAQIGLRIENCTVINTETGDHAIQINGTGSTGVIRNCALGADTAGAIVDAGGLMLVNTEITDFDAAVDTAPLDRLQTDVTAILADTAAADTAAEIAALVDANSVLFDAPRVVICTAADLSTGWGTADSPKTVATVTGDVLVQVVAVVSTNCTSTAGTGTLELGTTDSTASLLVQDAVDATAFQAGDVWTTTTAADNDFAALQDEWAAIGGGQDIIATIATNNMTAGAIAFYIFWIPLSTNGAIVTAL